MSNKLRIVILKSLSSQQVNNTLQEPGLLLTFVGPKGRSTNGGLYSICLSI